MRYVAAYMLATLGGKASPSAKDIENILGSVGIEAESDKIKKVLDELKGKDISQVIAEGEKKLASVPSGGGAVTAGSGSAAAPAGGASDAKAADKKEEKPESEEESDDDMGFGLFD